MSNNLDHLFKKALQDQRCAPPPQVWENIERSLGTRRRRVAAWWPASAAAMILLAMGLSVLQLQNQDMMPEQAQWVKITPTAVEPYVPADPEHTATESSAQPTRPTVSHSISLPAQREPLTAEPIMVANTTDTDIKNLRLTSASQQLSLKTQSIRRDIIPLVSGQAVKNGEEYLAILREATEIEPEKKEKHLKIALSGHVAPVYTTGNYNTSATNSRGYNYSSNQMSGMMNVSGGVRLAVAASSKISVQTGIFYSRLGQHTEEQAPRSSLSSFATSASKQDYEYIVTPLGNLKSRTIPISYRSEEAILLSNNNNSRTDGVEQIFNTLEIPLTVRYRFFENKVGLSIAGGFSGNIVVDNKVYMLQGDQKEYMGSTEDIRRFNLSTDLGIGIEVPLAKNIKIMLEPGFKYYLQSLSRDSRIDFRPYTFSLATGIGIEF